MIKKIKNIIHGDTLLVILIGENLLERFMTKNLKRNRQEFGVEKLIIDLIKLLNHLLIEKAMIILLIVGVVKKI